ncbi:MAG: hypothetical protein AAB370_10750 [Verrucomicrobiota bacterium]
MSATLNEVRVDSCYKTLRGLIDLIQLLWITAAIIVAVAGAVQAANGELLPGVLWICAGGAAIVMAVASKQAALLLVDIADCQIQLVKRQA